ncbi:phosphoesterase, partial [Streptomyces sp. SID10116]|nr:phosphoesterase [Streptomyces sp. SID10116]
GHAGIGGRLDVGRDDPVTVRLDVKGAPGCTVRFVTDQGVLHTSPALPESGAGTVEWRTTASYAAYVRAEVRHAPVTPGLPGPLTAFTNPIFLGR